MEASVLLEQITARLNSPDLRLGPNKFLEAITLQTATGGYLEVQVDYWQYSIDPRNFPVCAWGRLPGLADQLVRVKKHQSQSFNLECSEDRTDLKALLLI